MKGMNELFKSLFSCCSDLEHRAFMKRFVSLQFLNIRVSVGLLRRGISLSQGLYLHTGQHKHRINAHRHPCLEWNLNPRFQCSSGRRQVHALDRAATVFGSDLNTEKILIKKIYLCLRIILDMIRSILRSG
jgi:hypothetical protein